MSGLGAKETFWLYRTSTFEYYKKKMAHMFGQMAKVCGYNSGSSLRRDSESEWPWKLIQPSKIYQNSESESKATIVIMVCD